MAREWTDLFITGDSAGSSDGATAPEPEERRVGRFARLRENLRKTRQALGAEIQATPFEEVNDETWERLEEALIYADVGARTTAEVVGRLFLVSAAAHARIDLKRLHESLGASGRLSFGSAELLMEKLGVTPGSVTAFAVINDREKAVTMVLDANLMTGEEVNFHPLVNTATLRMARDDLIAFLRETGHEPLIVDLPAPPDGQNG